MDIRATVVEGIHAMQSGDMKRAEDLLETAYKADPENPDALHFYGQLRHRLGHNEKAEALLRESLSFDKDNPSTHSDLGNVLRMLDRDDEALQCYHRALRLDPRHAPSLNNIATIHRTAGRFAAAADTLREALKFAPDMAEAYHNLGICLTHAQKHQEAIDAFRESFRLGGDWIDPVRVSKLLYVYGRETEAETMLVDYLERHPDHEPSQFQLAAIRGEAVDRANDAYIQTHFDDFASSFDAVLAGLGYRAPPVIAEAMAGQLGPAEPIHRILDLGCGTGLCGPLMRPYASELVGIDLSQGMLEQALSRGYDALYVAELQDFLEKQPQASFDIIVSADTLIYLGNLVRTFAAVSHTLRPAGLFVATLEKLEDDKIDYKIDGSGRFMHSRRCIERLAAENGLTIETLREEVMREEMGEPVKGYVFAMTANA